MTGSSLYTNTRGRWTFSRILTGAPGRREACAHPTEGLTSDGGCGWHRRGSPRPAASPTGPGTAEVCEPGWRGEDWGKVPCLVALGRGCRSASPVHWV